MAALSQTIGPYTLEKRLGAGGMGEVYQAYDSRLDRRVAIKLIRPEQTENETARERFRREARAAAGLSHPSIVQIHDIVESGDSDAIVMELVDGERLSQRIARGALPVGEAVRIGREIAEGLAAAHARGLIHRDLKPDNVMITSEGRAKILDFGLAKRLEGEASLTEDHRVLGTFRAMSPEQAQGLPLDARSDLFSLGLLLYEMLSGRSPFGGSSTLETLTRICTHQQAPLKETGAGVPEGLSDLVDRLLEKDSARRPQSAREVASALETLGTGTVDPGATWVEGGIPRIESPSPSREPSSQGGAGGRPAPRGTRRWAILVAGLLLVSGVVWTYIQLRRPALLYVAVPRPLVTEGKENAGVGVLAASLRTSLLDALLSLERVAPLAPDQVDPITGSPKDIARATAAGEVLTAQLSCNPSICQVTMNRVRGIDGAILWSQNFSAPIEQPFLVSEAVRGYLRQAYPDHPPRPGASKPEVRAEDYAEYIRLYSSFDTRREEEFPIGTILERISKVRQSSPKFLDAFIFETYVLQHRFRSGRDPRDLARAYEVLDQARKLAPDDPRPLSGIFEVALLGENLDRAAAALKELERLQPGDARVIAQKARLLDRQGKPREASQLIAEAIRLSPSWKHLLWAADMEFRQGKVPQAQAHLEELLRRSPGNFVGQSMLAQVELLYGRPERAAALYSELVRRAPAFDEISNLGLAYFLLGRFPEAEESYRRAYQLRPRNPLVVLNLADVCLLLRHRDEAAKLYEQVLRLVAQDPTAASTWQMHSARAQALAHLGRKREAVEAVQQVLRRAGDNSQATWEVALVYALLGDRESALFNAGKAIEQGVEPRWFLFPWFDSLRADAEFRKLLAGPRKTAAS